MGNSTSFKKGQSGNPGGRPKQPPELVEALRAHTAAAIQTLVKALSAKEAGVRVRAAEAILDRAYGKPAQTVQAEAGAEYMALMQKFVDASRELREGEEIDTSETEGRG